jgi:thymidylate synthase
VLDNLRDDYPSLVKWVHEHGEPVNAHGSMTYELRNMSLTLLDPVDSLPLGVGRKLNLAIGAAEALQLVAGVTDPGLMARIQPRFSSFMDGGVLHGAYGPRLRWQLRDVPSILFADPGSRQAVCTIWDPSYDRSVPTAPRDLPCTVFLQFIFRNDKLELHTHMRSNDVVWGVSYDLFQFTQLQLTMAKVLGCGVGPYHHHATSFHLYKRDVGLLDRLVPTTILTRPTDLPTGFGDKSLDWDDVAMRARFLLDVATGRVVDGVNPNAFTPDERWYLDKLRPYWVAPVPA